MGTTAWTLAGITFSLPEDLQLTEAKTETAPSRIINVFEEGLLCRWEGRERRTFFASWWDPYPPRPGGPMENAEEWEAPFLGKNVIASRTALLGGARREVLMMSVELPGSHAWVNVRAEGLTKEEFNAVLASAALAIAGKIGKECMTCKKQDQ